MAARGKLGAYRAIGPWPYVAGAALFGAAVLAFLVQQDVPRDVWRPFDAEADKAGALYGWAIVVLAGAALVAGISTFAGPVQRALKGERVKAELVRAETSARVRQVLEVIFRDIASAEGAPVWTDLTVNAFYVSRGGAEDVLRRVALVTFSHRSRTGIVWTRGKGVVGRCWETGKLQHIDLASAGVAGAVSSPEEWDALPDSVRMGVTYSEMKNFGGGYAAVVAVPVNHSDGAEVTSTGVISVDGPAGSHPYLTSPSSQERLTTMAALAAPEFKILFDLDAP